MSETAWSAAIRLSAVLLQLQDFEEMQQLLTELKQTIEPNAPGAAWHSVALHRMEAEYEFRRGDAEKASALLLEAARQQAQISGSEVEEYADILLRLAQIMQDRKQYALAEANQREALQIYRHKFGELDERYLNELSQLAEIQVKEELYEQALETSQRHLALAEQRYGNSSPQAAKVMEATANVLMLNRRFQEAAQLFRRTLEIREATLAPDDPQVLESVQRMAGIHSIMNDLESALSFYERAVRMTEQKRETNAAAYLDAVMALGLSLRTLERYAESQRQYELAREWAKQKSGANSAQYATCLLGIAENLRAQNKIPQAEQVLKQAHAICSANKATDPKGWASCLAALALFYDGLGDSAKANAYRNEMPSQPPPDDRPRRQLAEELLQAQQVGELISQRHHAQAIPLLVKQLNASRELLGVDNTSYVATLMNLATCYIAVRNYGEAELIVLEAIERGNKIFGPNSSLVGITWMNLADLHQGLGEAEEAKAALRQAREIFTRPEGNDALLVSLMGREGLLLLATGELEAARTTLKQALELRLHYVHTVLPGLSGGEALAYLGRPDLWMLRDAVMLACDHSLEGSTQAYDAVWNTKSLLLQDLSDRLTRLPESDSARSLFQQLRAKRRELAEEALSPANEADEAKKKRRLAELNAEKERFEKELAQVSTTFFEQQRRRALQPRDAFAQLPPMIAVVELVRVSTWQRPEPGRSLVMGQTSEQYECFVILRDEDAHTIQRLALGPADKINDLIREWLTSLAAEVSADAVASTAQDQLRELVWQPIERLLGNRKAIAVIPDGLFTKLPWSALPGAAKGTVLLDEGFGFFTLPSSKRLAEILEESPSPIKTGNLLLVGGVDYGMPEESAGPATWPSLPQTTDEVQKIADLWKTRGKVQMLTGKAAAKDALLAELSNSQLAHLATHGFFADHASGAALPAHAAADVVFRGEAFDLQRSTVTLRNPLLASAIVLAGANRGGQFGLGECLLSAEEVAASDLRNLDLVVLSACETALGRNERENIFGLQTAFQMAGVPTAVGALWKVEDSATRALMVEFYRNLSERGLSRLDALREAQLRVRYDFDLQTGTLRGVGGVRTQKQHASANKPLPAYLWAAFSLSGDWR